MQPLWLALHLPLLPLEASVPQSSPSLSPGAAGAAVVVRGRVLACDALAQQAGVAPGVGVAAARMLAPGIMLLQRDAQREITALASLACWAGRFTPQISLTDDALLLEIGSCLSLFGGVQVIADTACAGLQAQGFSVVAAVAPTPQGALWLAQAGTGARCRDMTTLQRQLDALPIDILPAKAATALARFGARRLAEVRRLPAPLLGRRIGMAAMHLLACAYGEMADPRASFVFPERFGQSLALPTPVDNAAALLFATRRLTQALSGWLSVRQAGVRELRLSLQHERSTARRTVAPTELVLQLADITAAHDRFERLLRERLERLTLAAPVESIRLDATQVVARPGRNQALFADGDALAGQEALSALLERLRARLGDEQVYRIAVHDDHRPECATRRIALYDAAPVPPRAAAKAAAAASSASIASAMSAMSAISVPLRPARPLWLLDRPEPLREVDARPWRNGPLTLLAGPERIESGWWDGGEGDGSRHDNSAVGDQRRDYFVALAPNASWLWIYRECRAPGGWFLQGLFA